jgi:hypothetical protein
MGRPAQSSRTTLPSAPGLPNTTIPCLHSRRRPLTVIAVSRLPARRPRPVSFVTQLIAFGLRQVIGDGADDVAQIVGVVEQRFRDHSRTLPKALENAHNRAWQALGVALAGDEDAIGDRFAQSGDDAAAVQYILTMGGQPARLLIGRGLAIPGVARAGPDADSVAAVAVPAEARTIHPRPGARRPAGASEGVGRPELPSWPAGALYAICDVAKAPLTAPPGSGASPLPFGDECLPPRPPPPSRRP